MNRPSRFSFVWAGIFAYFLAAIAGAVLLTVYRLKEPSMCIHVEHTTDKPADPRKNLRDAIDEAALYLDLHSEDAHTLHRALPHVPAFNAGAPVLQQLLSALLAVVPKAQ